MARCLRFIASVIVPLAFVSLPLPSRAEPPASPVLLPGFPIIAGDNVLLAWSPVPGAVSYKVYLDGKLLDVAGASVHKGSLPVSGDEVRYQVSAVSERGKESLPGPPGTLRLRKIESPQGLEGAANPDQPSVVLAWNAVRGSMGYNLYRVVDMGEAALLHSGSDCQFRDRSVRKGSRYEYAVSAVDRFGREGDRSPWVAIGVPEEPQLPKVAQKPTGGRTAVGPGARKRGEEKRKEKLNVKAEEKEAGGPSRFDGTFREVMSIEKLKDATLWEVSYLGPGLDNVFWVILPREREVHAVNRRGEIVFTLGPALLDSAGKGFVPHKLAVGPDGRLVISDAQNGTVACFDRKGDLLWSRKVDPPSGAEKGVWEGFPASFRSLPATPSSVLVLGAEILVTDQRFQLFYRLSHDGDLRGYVTHYRKGKDTWRLRRVGELEAVPGRGILATLPLARKALLLNEEYRVVSEIEGSRKDRAAGFLGLHGVRFVPGEGVLFTDPTTGRVKLYDPDTGEHLRDLRTPMLQTPNMAAWDGEERLWVYLARDHRIAVLGREEPGR